jgi:hypothetical protein
MAEVTITQKALNYRRLFAADGTLNAPGTGATLAPALTDPLRNVTGVLAVGEHGVTQGANAKFIFFGVGTSTQTFNAKIIGWTRAGNLWIPVTMASLNCTLSSTAGAGDIGGVLATELFVGTLSVNSSLIQTGGAAWPSDGGIQLLPLNLAGFQRIQLAIGSGTASHGNALLSEF